MSTSSSQHTSEPTSTRPTREASMFDHTNHELYALTTYHEERHLACLVSWVLPLTLKGSSRWLSVALSPLGHTGSTIIKKHQAGHDQHVALNMLTSAYLSQIVTWGCKSSAQVDKLRDSQRNNLCYEHPEHKMMILSASVGWIAARVDKITAAHERYHMICQPVDHMTYHPARIPLRSQDLKVMLSEKDLKKLASKRIELHKLSQPVPDLILQDTGGYHF